MLGWIATALVGAVMITQVTGWPRGRSVSIVHALTPYLGASAVVVAAIAVWRRWLALATTAVATGLAVVLLSLPLFVPGDPPATAPGATGLRVAVANLLYSNTRSEEAADVLLDADADVIVFAEFTVDHQAVFQEHPMAGRYPHRIDRPDRGPAGIGVWSRTPLAPVDPPRPFASGIDVVVEHLDGPVRLLGVHVPSPVSDVDAWRQDLQQLEQISRSATTPLIVAGDLNASYWHPEFRSLLDAGFADAHITTGNGFATSWPTDGLVPPFVQLDRALTTGSLVATDLDDLDVPGSDHRGFVVTVARARPGAP